MDLLDILKPHINGATTDSVINKLGFDNVFKVVVDAFLGGIWIFCELLGSLSLCFLPPNTWLSCMLTQLLPTLGISPLSM